MLKCSRSCSPRWHFPVVFSSTTSSHYCIYQAICASRFLSISDFILFCVRTDKDATIVPAVPVFSSLGERTGPVRWCLCKHIHIHPHLLGIPPTTTMMTLDLTENSFLLLCFFKVCSISSANWKICFYRRKANMEESWDQSLHDASRRRISSVNIISSRHCTMSILRPWQLVRPSHCRSPIITIRRSDNPKPISNKSRPG